MANSRPKGRRGRGRSRKRRPAPGGAVADLPAVETAGTIPAQKPAQKPVNARARARTRSARANTGHRDPLSFGDRPPAPWHPWPLSELLILIGGIGTVVGLVRLGHGGISNGGPVLFAGLGAVALGTIEITWREHNAGYRSHTLILALLPVVVFHSAVVLGLSAVTTVSRLANLGLLVVDAAIFAVLFKVLRARFLDARARRIRR